MILKNFLASSLMAIGLVFNASTAPAAEKITILDDRGVAVEVQTEPARIAAISYNAADMALALGIMPTASTYMKQDKHPHYLLGLTEKMQPLGQRARSNLELLSDARPDVIVAIKRYTVANAAQFEKIAPYIAFNMELLSESYTEVEKLAQLFGKPELGKKLNDDFKRHLQEFSAQAPKDVHPRFQIMWAGDAPISFHSENTAAAIVTALGGDNIVGPMQPGGHFTAEISLETMLEKDPEVIFIHDSWGEATHENNPVWSQLSAVKNGRVHYVGEQWSETNGPIAREIVLREAAHFLYPDIFPAIDVREEAAMKTRRVECEKDERKQKDDILCFSGTEKDRVYNNNHGAKTTTHGFFRADIGRYFYQCQRVYHSFRLDVRGTDIVPHSGSFCADGQG